MPSPVFKFTLDTHNIPSIVYAIDNFFGILVKQMNLLVGFHVDYMEKAAYEAFIQPWHPAQDLYFKRFISNCSLPMTKLAGCPITFANIRSFDAIFSSIALNLS